MMLVVFFGVIWLAVPTGTVLAADSLAFDSLHRWYVDRYPFFAMEDTVYTFDGEYNLPEGYRHADSSWLTPFQSWVSSFPLWHRHMPIGQWKGGLAFQPDEVSRAVHLPWRGRDFRDYTIPFRVLGEWLFYQRRPNDLRFIPDMGETASFETWLSGKPAVTAQGELIFKPDGPREGSPQEYYSFLAFCMRMTTYRNLARNCDSIAEGEVAPGDLFIAHDTSGRSGVVYIVLHMIVNGEEGRLYAVATGCPEACDFHIPKINVDRHNPWATAEQITSLGSDYARAGFFRFKVR